MIAIPTELEQPFLQLAQNAHKPVNELITLALTEFLEDYHDARLAELAIEKIHNAESKLLSLEEFNRVLVNID